MDLAPQALPSLGSGGRASATPATSIVSISTGSQPSSGMPVQSETANVHVPSATASMSQAGSPSVQTTPLAPFVASTPPYPRRQSLSAFPPPRTKARAVAAISRTASAKRSMRASYARFRGLSGGVAAVHHPPCDTTCHRPRRGRRGEDDRRRPPRTREPDDGGEGEET